MTKKRAPKIRYSKKLATFICKQIEAGHSVADICRKHGRKKGRKDGANTVPESATIYKWRREHPEFKEQYDIAYQTYMYSKIDELSRISAEKAPTVDEIVKATGQEDPHPSIVRAYLSDWRAGQRSKIDVLKLITAKLAPKLIPELSDKVQVDHKVDNQLRIVLPDWGLDQSDIKIIDQEGDVLLDKPEDSDEK